jgi:uncharacterized protein (TIGR00730 family)
LTKTPVTRPDLIPSSAWHVPALDQEFLLGDSMRGVRFMLEYAKAEECLRAWGVETTIVVFGSARVKPLEEGVTPSPLAQKHAYWYEQARRFGRLVSEEGGALTPIEGKRHNVIATGGGPGIMEAANRGAYEAGAPSIGFNITLPMEQNPNPYSTPDLTFCFHYFAMRKMHLAMRSNALMVFPGGYGTMDELFEILTLRQTGKSSAKPIILFDPNYWKGLINLQHFVDHGMIDAEDLDLFQTAASADEAWEKLKAMGVLDAPKPPTSNG